MSQLLSIAPCIASEHCRWEIEDGDNQYFSWETFSAVCLGVTIVGTVLLGFDLYVLKLRHDNKLRMRKDASERSKEMGELNEDAKASNSKLWYVPLIIIVLEDIPQMVRSVSLWCVRFRFTFALVMVRMRLPFTDL
jgi:hypothetical protein